MSGPPPRPWEQRHQGPNVNNLLNDYQQFQNPGNSSFNNPTSSDQVHASGSRPPPLPPRPGEQYGNRSIMANNRGYSGFGGHGFGSPFSGLGLGHNYQSPMFGGSYGGGGFGGGYSSMNRYGSNPAVPYGNQGSDFVRVAEESSRQAFQSIESIVQAFGSISSMLESTYFAVHSSFHAVLGVTDHMSRMRTHLTQLVSTLAVIKMLKKFVLRILYYLGLIRNDPTSSEAWNEAMKSTTNANGVPLTPDAIHEAFLKDDHRRSSWPIMIFFAVVLGTPWLIWKILGKMTGNENQASSNWASEEGEHYVAHALYDFETQTPREASFKTGDRVIIAPKDLQPRIRGWLLASVGNKTGLVPSNYLRIKEFKKKTETTES